MISIPHNPECTHNTNERFKNLITYILPLIKRCLVDYIIDLQNRHPNNTITVVDVCSGHNYMHALLALALSQDQFKKVCYIPIDKDTTLKTSQNDVWKEVKGECLQHKIQYVPDIPVNPINLDITTSKNIRKKVSQRLKSLKINNSPIVFTSLDGINCGDLELETMKRISDAMKPGESWFQFQCNIPRPQFMTIHKNIFPDTYGMMPFILNTNDGVITLFLPPQDAINSIEIHGQKNHPLLLQYIEYIKSVLTLKSNKRVSKIKQMPDFYNQFYSLFDAGTMTVDAPPQTSCIYATPTDMRQNLFYFMGILTENKSLDLYTPTFEVNESIEDELYNGVNCIEFQKHT